MARATARPKTRKAASKRAVKKRAASARTRKAAARKPAPAGKISRPKQAKMLSRTTMRAKWVESVDEHEDRPGQSLATRSHDVIMKWAGERGAEPATVESTRHDGRPGVLRFDFPGFGGRRLQKISWDEWFTSFDERKLVFVYQEHMKKGNQSNFFRLDNPEREEA